MLNAGGVVWSDVVMSVRMDIGNSVLAGLLVYLARRLQSVLNAAARLTYHLRRSDHITDAFGLSSLAARLKTHLFSKSFSGYNLDIN